MSDTNYLYRNVLIEFSRLLELLIAESQFAMYFLI